MKHEQLNCFGQALIVGMYQVRARTRIRFSNSILTFFTAQYWLANRYLNGYGVDQNKQEAIRLYRAAASQGYAPAQYSLGNCYRKRDGVEVNKLMAASLFKMAADNGYQYALYGHDLKKLGLNEVIARCVFVIDITQQYLAIVDSLRGVVIESLQRDEQSLENVTADVSAERNEYHKLELHQLYKLDDAEALFQIADRVVHGIGIKENTALAWGENVEFGLNIMIEAACRGHAVALGVCFLRGRGAEKNEVRAIELFRASADREHASGSRTNSHSIFKLNSHNFRSSIQIGRLLFQRLWS
jgi:TPR repeat protein